jgi:hypothetical protein
MVALREVLSRFRPVAAPGAPTGAAVPADRAAVRDAELKPVFASLDDAEAGARGIRDQAAVEAAAIRAGGARQADALLREALERAPGERERAARQVRLEADEYCAAVFESSSARIDSMNARAGPRVEAFVGEAVAEVAARLRRAPGADR